MTQIITSDQPLYYAEIVAGAIANTGTVLVGDYLATGRTIEAHAKENDLLFALSGNSAPAMPDAGTEVAQGKIYDYSGTLYRARQTHTRTEHDPATIPDRFTRYQADSGAALDWVAGEQVYIGTQRLYEDVLYQCLQAHQTQSNTYPTAPGILGVLWGVVLDTEEWAVGVAYIGDNTAGAGNGDVVTYEGSEYRCLQSHTSIVTWYPTAPGILGVLWVSNV